jgi:hypothetical protein
MEEDIFFKYTEILDDQFDDCLDITYFNYGIPTIKIIYDPTVNYDDLNNALPIEWIDNMNAGKLQIIMKEFNEESDEYKQTIDILNTPVMLEMKERVMDFFNDVNK